MVSQAGRLSDREATLRPIALQSVYAGQVCIGHVISRGKLGFEAFDAGDISLGLYLTTQAAVAAINGATA